MADSSPDHRTAARRLGSSPPSEPPPRPGSPSRATVPPSEPRGTSRHSFPHVDLGGGGPARLQMIVALVLGLALVAVPLYLWRRPRATSIALVGDGGAELSHNAPLSPVSEATDEKPSVTEVKVLQCQDPGPGKTPPEQCDHAVDLEKAFVKAIEESASCVPKDVGGGTVTYVADVSFKRKTLNVLVPKEGRTVKSATAVSACQAAVKTRLQSLSLDAVAHGHARYKLSALATYRGTVKQ